MECVGAQCQKLLRSGTCNWIFETNTIGVENEVLNVDDVIETANQFRCIDMIIDNAKAALTEKLIKELHLILKNGTSDSRKEWFAVGDYKKMPNEVGGMDTALPEEVADKMKELLTEYNAKEEKTFEDILDLFETVLLSWIERMEQ